MAFYRRKLPHWQPHGAQYFLTLRLKGSIPLKVINELKQLRKELNNLDESVDTSIKNKVRREVFRHYELALDSGTFGPRWLKIPEVANIIQDSLHYRDTKEYNLFAYCVMSNHVHIVFEHINRKLSNDCSAFPSEDFPITEILRNFKRYTALECNKILNRKGSFWQPESFDRVIRDDEELGNTMAYTLNNPVKAGIVSHWNEWPYTYCKPEFKESFM